jgi:uncharacterized membrane protein
VWLPQAILKIGDQSSDNWKVTTQSRLPAKLATVGIVAQAVLLSSLVIRQFSGPGSPNWDLGIFTQATYNLSHGDSFMSIRGMDILGHHFNLILYLLAPIMWLGGGARELSLIQVFALVLGAWPAFLLGRDRVAPEASDISRNWFGLLASVIYLLHPAVTGLSWWMFHPETLGLGAVLWAWWAIEKRRWWLYVLSVLWIVVCREDLSLAMVGFGLATMFICRKHRRSVVAGALTLLSCFAYWVAVTQVVMPDRLGTDEPYYVKDFWGHLGNTMPEVIATAARHPGRATEPLHGSAGVEFAASLVGPTGGSLLLSPVTLIPALPQLAAITLSNDPDSRQSWHHHGALLLPFSVLSAVEAMRWLRKKRPKLLGLYIPFVVFSATMSYLLMSPTPIGPHANWWSGPTAASTALHKAVESIPSDATVAASLSPGNMLANRREVFTWPNPWKKWKRGYEFEQLPNPNTVEYLVLVRAELNPQHDALFRQLLGSSGTFEVVSDNEGVVVAHRRERRRE